jgi:hypothetical protein
MAGVGAMCGLVVISLVLLASSLSSLMDRPVGNQTGRTLELPLPREWAGPNTARVDERADDEPAALPRFEEPAAVVPGERAQHQIAPGTSSAASGPLTEAERVRRTAAWLLRAHEKEAAQSQVRAAIAFYEVEGSEAAFWGKVLETMSRR